MAPYLDTNFVKDYKEKFEKYVTDHDVLPNGLYTELAMFQEEPPDSEDTMECNIPTIWPDIGQNLCLEEQISNVEDIRRSIWTTIKVPHEVPFLEH